MPAKTNSRFNWSFCLLNFVRFISIIACLSIVATNGITVLQEIKTFRQFLKTKMYDPNSPVVFLDYIPDTTIPNRSDDDGIFWAVLNRSIIIGQALVLCLSEMSWDWTERFFDRFFPLLGKNYGLGALGVIQMFIGAAVLSGHIDILTLASASAIFGIGGVNVLLGLWYRESAKAKRALKRMRGASTDVEKS